MEPAVKLNKKRKEPLPPPPPEWPSWLTREEVQRLPPRARQEVEEVLVPAYRKLVREKEDPRRLGDLRKVPSFNFNPEPTATAWREAPSPVAPG